MKKRWATRRSAAQRSRGSALLDAADVTFAYSRSRAPVITGVSISIAGGDIVGLLGPNGAGKPTLLRILAGLVAPQAGRLLVDGQPLAAFSRRDLARRIAVVPQETHS